MATSPYGLSIVLDFDDNASAGMQKAANTFSSLSGSVDALSMGIGGTADSLLDMNTSVVGMSVMGSQLQNMGTGLLGVLGSVSDKVMATSSSFENFDITLQALYKDEQKAVQVTNDLFKYATKSPYQVEDLQSMVVTLKSQGVEAFEEVKRASDGVGQSAMDWIGDLQAFRPGETATKWKMAIQNFLSGTNNQSALRLRNILDVGDLATYLGHELGDTVEERMQDLTEIVGKIGMTGMQNKLANTWSVVIANMEDAWSQFTYRLGFGNKDTNMYKTATNSAKNLLSAMTDVFTNDEVIKSVSEAFNSLVKPIENVTELVAMLGPSFAKWLGQHPKVAKMATGITAIGGASLYALGSLLKLSSGAMNWLLNVQRLGGISGMLNLLGNAFNILSYRVIGLGATAGLLYTAWTGNFFGIRDALKSLGGQVGTTFNEIYSDMFPSAEELRNGQKALTLMEALEKNGLKPFVNGLKAVSSASKEVGKSFREGVDGFFKLFGLNIPALTAETFNFKEMLNNLGDNLLERFGDPEALREKYGGLFDTFGKVSGALMTAFGVTTLLGGAFKLLSGSMAMFGTNLKVITASMFSPVGLLGLGLTGLVLGYQNDFLGLQDTVTPIVDKLNAKMKQLQESFGQKGTKNKSSIITAISDGMKRLNAESKTWRFGDMVLADGFNADGSRATWKRVLDDGYSLGEVLAQGIASGLIAFGGPVQKAIGVLMWGFATDLGNIRSGTANALSQLINVKDLLVEMSTGYGPKSKTLATRFGLVEFAEGMVRLKNTTKSLLKNFVDGFADTNRGLGKFIKDLFPDLDFSINGILNAFGRLGTKISNFFGLDASGNVADNFAQIAHKLGEITSKALILLPLFRGLTFMWGNGVSPLALSGVVKSLDFIRGSMSQTLVTLSSGLSSMFTSFTSLGPKVASIWKFALQSALLQNNNGGNRFGGFNNNNNGLFGAFRQHIAHGMDGLSNFARGRVAVTWGRVSRYLSSEWSAGFSLIGDSWTDAWRDFSNGSVSFLGGVRGAFSDTMSVLNIGLQETRDNILHFFNRNSQFTTGFVHSLSSSISSGILQTVTSVVTSIQLAKWGVQLEMLKTGVSMFASSLAGSIKTVIGLTGAFSGLAAILALGLTFGTLTTSQWNTLTEAMKGQETVLGKVSVAWDWFNKNLAGTTTKVTEFLKSFDVSSLTHKLLNFVGTLGDGIASIVYGEGGNNGLASLGMHLIDSILKGISNGSGRIGQNIQKVLSATISSIKTYVPSIGRSFGNIVGDIMEFVGSNAKDVIEAGFTIMESFVKGLVENKDKIVDGAMKIVDALCEGIIIHAPDIINGVSSIITALSNGLASRGKQIGVAAEAIITPIWTCITKNTPKLWSVARKVIGGLMDLIVGELATGAAKIMAVVGIVSGILTALFTALATAAASNPLTAVFAPGLAMTAVQLGALTIGLEAGAGILGTFGAVTKATSRLQTGFRSSVAKTNSEIEKQNKLLDTSNKSLEAQAERISRRTMEEDEYFKNTYKGQLEQISKSGNPYMIFDFDEGYKQIELTQDRLKQAFGTGEEIYRVNVTVDENGKQQIESVAQKVQKIKDEDGKVYYQTVDIQVNGETFSNVETRLIKEDGKIYSATYVVNEDGSLGGCISKTAALQEQIDKIPEEKIVVIKGETDDEFIVNTVGTLDDGTQVILEAITKSKADVEEELKKNPLKLPIFFETPDDFAGSGIGNATMPMPATAPIPQKEETTEERVLKLTVEDTEANDKLNSLEARVNEVCGTGTGSDATSGTNGRPIMVDVYVDPAGAEELRRVEEDLSKVKEQSSITISTVTDLASLSVINTVKTLIDDIKKSANITLSITASESSSVTSFQNSVNSLVPEKSVKVSESGSSDAKILVDDLVSSISSLEDKTVEVKADVYGKVAVDNLATAISNVTSKTVTVKADVEGNVGGSWWSNIFGGKKARGGRVSLNDAFTLMNEQGGEIVDLPAGSRVYPHDDSVQMGIQDGYKAGVKSTADLIRANAVNTSPVATAQVADQSSHDTYDNSVHFGAGSIVVKVDHAKGDVDYEAAADKIWYYIQKKQKHNAMARRG